MTMKYYSLEHEIHKEVIGPYPQSEGMAEYYPYKREDSIRFLGYENNFVPNLDAIQLSRGAKLTDMLSVVVINKLAGKILSERFKMLLQSFHLPKHCFFKAKVISYKKETISDPQYYLFRLLEHQNKFINFDKSEFYIHRRGKGKIADIHICKESDLDQSPEELGLGSGQFIRPEFITLFSEADFDIFCFKHFAGFFISERLKTAIEQSGLTGIRFEPAPFLLQDELSVSASK